MTIETFDFSLLSGLVNLALVAKLFVGLAFLAILLGFATQEIQWLGEATEEGWFEEAEEGPVARPIATTLKSTCFEDLLVEQMIEDLEKLAQMPVIPGPRLTEKANRHEVPFGHPDWAATAVW